MPATSSGQKAQTGDTEEQGGQQLCLRVASEGNWPFVSSVVREAWMTHSPAPGQHLTLLPSDAAADTLYYLVNTYSEQQE